MATDREIVRRAVVASDRHLFLDPDDVEAITESVLEALGTLLTPARLISTWPWIVDPEGDVWVVDRDGGWHFFSWSDGSLTSRFRQQRPPFDDGVSLRDAMTGRG